MSLSAKLPRLTWKVRDLAEVPQMRALWAAVVTDTGHPLLVHFLARLIDISRVPARDPVRLARALQLYSARKIKFFRERPERFQSALRTIAWGIGDCDDKARFIAASLRTFRIPVRLKFLHLTLPGGQVLGHVYPQAWLPTRNGASGNRALTSSWVALESVREYPLGYDPETKARALGYGVKVTYIGDPGEDQTHI